MSSVYLRMELWEQVLFMTGGACAIAACVASGLLIFQHLRFWSDASRQKWIVRILIMVPIYSIDSWFSLRFNAVSTYLKGYGTTPMRCASETFLCVEAHLTAFSFWQFSSAFSPCSLPMWRAIVPALAARFWPAKAPRATRGR